MEPVPPAARAPGANTIGLTLPQAMQQALAACSRHDWAEAERLCRQMLNAKADYFDALTLLGMIAVQSGRPVEALGQFRRAAAANPNAASAHMNVGNALQDLNRPSEALASYDQVLRLDPNNAEAHYSRGNALQDLMRLDEALISYDRALKLQPDYAEAYNNRGIALQELERLDEAVASYDQAIKLNAELAEAHNNRGNALKELKRFDEALVSYDQALKLQPYYSEAYNNRGVALQELKRLDDALASYDQALKFAPGYADAHNNRGNALMALKRPNEALASYEQALKSNPGDAEAWNNRGITLGELKRQDEALASYEQALKLRSNYAEAYSNRGNVLRELKRPAEALESCKLALNLNPSLAEAHCNLGNALSDLGRLDEAEASYRRAIEINPDFAMANYDLGVALQGRGRFAEAEASYRRAMQIDPDFVDAHSNLIFTLDLREGYGVAEQQAERRRWYEQHARRHSAAGKRHDNTPDPERRLRVGFVSADFRRHSAYYAFSPIIVYHDRDAFEAVCYSGVTLEDDATARLRQAAREWRSTLAMSDEALAEQIRRDRIDILVDLSGHSAGNRLLVFARKPAPVQITAWGHATGTGLATMDYFLADPVIVPREEKRLYVEEVIDLTCFLCYEPPDYLPEVSRLPALGARPFVFGCINRIEKISDRVIGLWGRIMAALPEAHLLLKDRVCDDPSLRQQLLQRLAAGGIAPARVRILGNTPHPEHLKVYQEVDAGLDPFPHGGGISTAEALWMGVPVVTLSGSTVASRASASILTTLGMQAWIARSEDEYVRIAVQAARDLPRLSRLREGLRTRAAASALGDVQRYTRDVETAFRKMWRRWCTESARTY